MRLDCSCNENMSKNLKHHGDKVMLDFLLRSKYQSREIIKSNRRSQRPRQTETSTSPDRLQMIEIFLVATIDLSKLLYMPSLMPKVSHTRTGLN